MLSKQSSFLHPSGKSSVGLAGLGQSSAALAGLVSAPSVVRLDVLDGSHNAALTEENGETLTRRFKSFSDFTQVRFKIYRTVHRIS